MYAIFDKSLMQFKIYENVSSSKLSVLDKKWGIMLLSSNVYWRHNYYNSYIVIDLYI